MTQACDTAKPLIAALLLALSGCDFFVGDPPTAPIKPTCQRGAEFTMVIRNAAGDSVGVNSIRVCGPVRGVTP